MRGKIQRYKIENVLKNIFIVFERKKQGRASLIMLPRMKSISDCNVIMFVVVERRVVKPLKTWRD